MVNVAGQKRRFVRRLIAEYAVEYGYSGESMIELREHAEFMAAWHVPYNPLPINRRHRRHIRQTVSWGDVMRALSPTMTNYRLSRAHRGGGRYVVHCPFHDEKSPSLIMFPDGGFHCHGCGKTGDILDFVATFRPLRTTRDIRAFFGPLMQPLSSA